LLIVVQVVAVAVMDCTMMVDYSLHSSHLYDHHYHHQIDIDYYFLFS
jgi:hypothetical protein